MVIADNLAFTMLSFWNLHDKHLFLCPIQLLNSYESEGLLLKYLFIVRQDLIVV